MDAQSIDVIEDEDSDSSSFDTESDGDEPVNLEQRLDDFRDQWHQELNKKKSAQSKHNERKLERKPRAKEEMSIIEKAKKLFLQGVHEEQTGNGYGAIRFYKQAMHLVPDIEFKIEELRNKARGAPSRERQISTSSLESGNGDEDYNEEDLKDLIHHFNILRVRNEETRVCMPNNAQTSTHISALPMEVMVYIFKWVVSEDLDTRSLEQLSMVCRGFFLCARDDEIWRLICIRLWGVNGVETKRYGSWRNMYLNRPHLRFNGCYISKTVYHRPGEPSLDQFYRPWHSVCYYRYIRFFTDGSVLFYTSTDEPPQVVKMLHSKECKFEGLKTGHYKLVGDKVNCFVKVCPAQEQEIGYFKRNKRQQNNQNGDKEEVFHMEFLLKSNSRKPNAALEWNHYAATTIYKTSGQELSSAFKLKKDTFPTLYFSRVKRYGQIAQQPLK